MNRLGIFVSPLSKEEITSLRGASLRFRFPTSSELAIPGAQTHVVLYRSTPDRIGLPSPAFAAAFGTDSVETTFRELSARTGRSDDV